jgi:pimeloyl-ACP methyl ester carboxylesterase
VSTAALWRIAVTLLCLRPLYCSAQNPDQFLDSGGVKIRYVIAGKGEPVVLIHPFAASAEIWEPIIKDLSQNYRVIAMDCRGHGKSDKPHDPKQYGIKMVDDVVRLLDQLEMKKATIVGYSMGGSIAIKMLTEHPDRFRAAIIGGSLGFTRYESEHDEAPRLGPSLLSGMPLSEAMIASAPADWPKPSPQQREMMKRMDAAQDPIALGAETVSHEGLWVDDVELKSITVPTLQRFTSLPRVVSQIYNSRKSKVLAMGQLCRVLNLRKTFKNFSANKCLRQAQSRRIRRQLVNSRPGSMHTIVAIAQSCLSSLKPTIRPRSQTSTAKS